MELLVGAGNSKEKRVWLDDRSGWTRLVTLDINPDGSPDVLADLASLPLPFKDNTFDEVHAYEVLEHMGAQGDWRFFFNQFDEFARILKPSGLFVATSPPYGSKWVWGDPGHTRYMGPELYTFLQRAEYDKQIGKTSMTDYRRYFKSDWESIACQTTGEEFLVMLRNLK
jgi:SAM-dependent methyltransferase